MKKNTIDFSKVSDSDISSIYFSVLNVMLSCYYQRFGKLDGWEKWDINLHPAKDMEIFYLQSRKGLRETIINRGIYTDGDLTKKENEAAEAMSEHLPRVYSQLEKIAQEKFGAKIKTPKEKTIN